MGKCILVTGGARSGKSQFVLAQATKINKSTLFVATAEAGDEEMRTRIEAHKKNRPTNWRTLEARINLSDGIAKNIGDAQVVIIDCITLLTNNIFMDNISHPGKFDASKVEKYINTEINGLLAFAKQSKARFFIVTNEIGMGIVPEHPMSRLYRDLLGKANQHLAQKADEVYLLIAGIPIKVK